MTTSAPVYSFGDEQRARSESAAWSRFTAPRDSYDFCASWLALLCARMQGARAALLLVGDEGEAAFTVGAAWPDRQRDLQYLGPTAQRALNERRGVVVDTEGGLPDHGAPAQVAYPVEVSGRLFGAVVVDLASLTRAELQGALRQIHWASGWLVDHFRQDLLGRREAELTRVAALNELTATALQFGRLRESVLAVANELTLRLRCDRVSIGLDDDGRMVPLAISHTASFDHHSDLVRALGAAMDEVLDLGVALRHPTPEGEELSALAHADAARALRVEALLSVPLSSNGQTLGVITLERNAGPAFGSEELRIVQALGVTLGSVWTLHRANERGLLLRACDASRSTMLALVGPRHPGLKLIVAVVATLLLCAALVRSDYRISAPTVIEGETQIASVAPFEGFITAGYVRAGDTVKRGQPLARLDDRDLKLESARWASEREQASRKYQAAMAAADRSAMSVLAAQIAQCEAQLALAEDKLSRTTLVAPFDGIVVSGDLSQKIGTPVETGKLLFEVAPLAAWRVVLQVDDRDMGGLALGQTGELVLSSLPGLELPLEVTSITPVATQRDGRNVFRVEARMKGSAPARLRPGMEGVGKVSVGRHSVIWIWTHGLSDALRLGLWNWMP